MRRTLIALAVAFGLAPAAALAQTQVLSDMSALVGEYRSELFEIDIPEGGGWVLLASDAFDTLLLIVDAEGDVAVNDDHASGDSRLGSRDSAVLLEEAGRYVVIATSYMNLGRGTFRLLLSGDAALRPLEAGAAEAEIAAASGYLSDVGDVAMASDASAGEGTANFEMPDMAALEPAFEMPVDVPPAPVTVIEGPPSGERPATTRARNGADPCSPRDTGAELEQLFPWPPPDATDRLDLLRSYFEGDATLGEVSDTLMAALTQNGYSGSGFWAVGDTGFAIATRMEQTDHAARPLDGQRRFAASIAHVKRWSLEALVRSMLLAEPGFYRTIVFIVTELPFSEAPSRCTQEIVEAWANSGSNRLPREMEAQPFSIHHRVTALIYEFSKTQSDDSPAVNRTPLNGAIVHLADIRRTLEAR